MEPISVTHASRNVHSRHRVLTIPNAVLKLTFAVQLFLTSSAAQSSVMISGHNGTAVVPPFDNIMLLMPSSYVYLNSFILFFGLFALLHTESSESVFMVSDFCC